MGTQREPTPHAFHLLLLGSSEVKEGVAALTVLPPVAGVVVSVCSGFEDVVTIWVIVFACVDVSSLVGGSRFIAEWFLAMASVM